MLSYPTLPPTANPLSRVDEHADIQRLLSGAFARLKPTSVLRVMRENIERCRRI